MHKLGGEMVKHNYVHRLFRFLTTNITVRKGGIFHKRGVSCPRGTNFPKEYCPRGHYFHIFRGTT